MAYESTQAPVSAPWCECEVWSFHDLRGIATRLSLNPTATITTGALCAQIVEALQRPAVLQQIVDSLSTLAKAALWWLCFADAVPAVPFVAEFGQVRRVTGRTRYAPPPWQGPQSAAEELFYCGLLHPLPGQSLDQSRLFTLAPELRQRLQPLVAPFAPTGQPSALPEPLPPDHVTRLMQSVISSLCHDVGHYLIYLYQVQIRGGQPITVRHGRWLTPLQLRALAPRLLCPLPVRQLRAHKGTPHLRLLAFLTTIGGLQEDGQVTVMGWDWLAQPRAQQVSALWQAWVHASQAERTAFGTADCILAAPWPQLLLAGLAACPQPFTSDQLAAAILSASGDFAVYWAAQLPLLQPLALLVADLVTTILVPLGLIVELPGAVGWLQWTAAGEAFAHLTENAPTMPAQQALATTDSYVWMNAIQEVPAFQAQLTAVGTDSWLVTCSAATSLAAQAHLAGFADYLPAAERGALQPISVPAFPSSTDDAGKPERHHHYRISVDTLARAAAHGLGLPSLQAALSTMGIVITAAQWQAWSLAHQQGDELSIETVTLLRSRQPNTLAALVNHGQIDATLTEILAPTAAIVGTEIAALVARLANDGHYPALVGLPQASSPPTLSASITSLTDGQATALWLAGELYRLLGRHLPLPAPASILPQDTLWAMLSPQQQAIVTAQRQVLADALATLLDDLPFTPPPNPSDPAQWLPLIDHALDTQQRLQMTYFSAGRNLATQRLVEPYWVEEHNGVGYLRAYCHSAGRVLTFRLDRVEGGRRVLRAA